MRVGGSYEPGDGKIKEATTFVSRRGEAADVRKQNYKELIDWYVGIVGEVFGRPGGRHAVLRSGARAQARRSRSNAPARLVPFGLPYSTTLLSAEDDTQPLPPAIRALRPLKTRKSRR